MTPRPLTAAWVRSVIPRRPAFSHKGKNGHVLLVAGSRGMMGAAILSGLGTLRSGAGLLTIALPESIRRTVSSRLPEAMTIKPSEIPAYVRRRTITTLAIGPGLGVGMPQKKLVLALMRMNLPMVLDADGLNNISSTSFRRKPEPRTLDWAPASAGVTTVISPHPGELAKLLGKSVKEIQKDRVGTAADTAKRLNLICILKGHQTVISDGKRTFLNSTGNQAMATGGMGDVLTGVIAGLLAQGLSPFDAACAGVYLHGLAGDLARVSDRGLLATDVSASIPRALKKIGIR